MVVLGFAVWDFVKMGAVELRGKNQKSTGLYTIGPKLQGGGLVEWPGVDSANGLIMW
jgi:hypothetical protein